MPRPDIITLCKWSSGTGPEIAVEKFGQNPDIDSGVAEDLWGGATATWVEPTAARIHQIASTSVNDTAAGTGARTVYIEGLDGSGHIATETVTLNGTSNVATGTAYTMIHRMTVATAGSGTTNAGDITATANTDATVTCVIKAGLGTCLLAVYKVPSNYTAFLLEYHANMTCSTSGAYVDIYCMTKASGSGSWVVRNILGLSNVGSSAHDVDYELPLYLPSGTILKFRGENPGANNIRVGVHFHILLIPGVF